MSRAAATIALIFGVMATASGCVTIHQIAPSADGTSVFVLARNGADQGVYQCTGAIDKLSSCERLFGAAEIASAEGSLTSAPAPPQSWKDYSEGQ